MLELKQAPSINRWVNDVSFNLSMLELKRELHEVISGISETFNLSMLELKRDRQANKAKFVCLLISPCWN